MDFDYVEKVKAAYGKLGRTSITAADAVAETKIEDTLFSDFGSRDQGRVNISAFRVEALLNSARKAEFAPDRLQRLRDALLTRIHDASAPICCSDIAIVWFCRFDEPEQRSIITSLFNRMRGIEDYWLIAYSAYLVPILGLDYLYEFQNSTVIGESGGMGGPPVYSLRNFALERLCFHLKLKPNFVECFDGKVSYHSWSQLPQRKH